MAQKNARNAGLLDVREKKRSRVLAVVWTVQPSLELGSLQNYLDVGHQIQGSQLLDRVDGLLNKPSEDLSKHSFVLLAGPAGVGKTQTALALALRRKSLYLLTSEMPTDAQAVLIPFGVQSQIFFAMVQKDRNALIGRYYSLDLEDLPLDVGFYMLGFVGKLWKQLGDGNQQWPRVQAGLDFQVPTTCLSVNEFRRECPQFCIILDEIPFLGHERDAPRDEVQFLLNVLRLVGHVVLLGTDSTVANLAPRCTMSRWAENYVPSPPYLWCTVFKDFLHV